MAKSIPPLTDDMQKIIDCSLFNDPRVSVKHHRFCVDCSERRSTEENPCPLCRTFKEVQYSGCHGYPGSYIKDKLSDLHQQYVENRLKVTGEKHFDIPLIDRFHLSVGIFTATRVAWLENKLYVLCDKVIRPGDNVNRLRVFADHAPYEELPEEIVLDGIEDAYGMAASVSTRSIFFSDPFERCIWKLQIPQNEVKRFPVSHMPFWLSVGQDEELFVVINVMAYKDTKSIYIYSVADVSLVKSILLPKDISRVSCIAQSPNRDIVITHRTFSNRSSYFISILSTDGEIIRTFNPGLHESLTESWYPSSFAIVDTGDIFVVDPRRGMICMLNSQLTDFQIISCFGIQSPALIFYIKEKQQVLISEGLTYDSVFTDEEDKPIHVLHLSPCNVETKKLMKNLQ